ncbi:hypothetical protein M441DRAFT_52146 [Trichoderma asperellum CBS 433.97]|uniref:C2H2-type domain-containing protein n=1 Tax=Trichoderma asperellum (strain ATCC 204424 / CBS 433.97 / NBRC 101777) TaxID=1042311 RepID=A0A2T3YSM6_TRIA4|nr:hypothetical protein M441DRAFT_52146 [Trichoderma asperellum CBS 433.97]PTB35529.1 hypothetical protein M441DRAFT_52146 [Trichoderma asperellum CBS 433.97]
MTLELEGLIARLLLVISCAGEQGLSISQFIDAAKLALSPPDTTLSLQRDVTLQDSIFVLSDYGVGTIWRWLVQRTDISIGPQRKYNQLMFEEVLALEDLRKDRYNNRHGQPSGHQNARENHSSSLEPSAQDDIRIYVSQETMWEAITGHAVDYKRVPRSEWLLLLGIASTKAQGILQGDLGRLVDQDKRSVPKRTDALVKKGYITKRTTLVRGTKTSKMWLKLFAPPLPKDRSATAEPEAEMNLSRQVLAVNLDAVPWHTRWTGESVDYTALATTIMAICKEWDVLRMQDLKSKLGVLGMRWQMKVVSKVCRFLNARDAIRYVAARLNNKVFNDCVRFNRDLTPKDWSIFLATGKRAGKLSKTTEVYNQDGQDGAGSLLGQFASSKCLGVAPPWSADQPLAVIIAKSIMACGEAGLTNPDVYGLTLGVSFTRFLSSLTTCISTPNIQPIQLQYLQVRSEHSRAGKVASYRYSMSSALPAMPDTMSDTMSANSERERQTRQTNNPVSYGFLQAAYPIGSSKLANLTQSNLSQRRQRGRPRKMRSEHPADADTDRNNIRLTPDVTDEVLNPPKEDSQPCTGDSMIIKLRLPQETLKGLMNSSSILDAPTEEISLRHSKPSSTEVMECRPVDGELDITAPKITTSQPSDSTIPIESAQLAGRKRGRGRGRTSGRPGNLQEVETSNNDTAKGKRWKCDKCDKTWKNDIGLKYHLERSQTSCNPSYSPSNLDGLHREMKSTLRFARTTESTEKVVKVPAKLTRGSRYDEPIKTTNEKERAKRGREENEHDAAKISQFKISPIRTNDEESRYSQVAVSATTPSHTGEIYAINRSSSDQSISQHRKMLNISSLPQQQAILMPVDISQSNQVLDLKNRKYDVNQLENLSNTLAWPSSGFLPSVSELDLQDNSSERLKPASKVTDLVKSTEKTEMELVTNAKIYESASINLESEGFKKKTSRNEITDHISSLLMEMLIERKGVLPGGHSLWRALATVWNTRYPEKPIPKTKDYQWALSRMLKDKAVLEHWHGFQDHSGLFSKCQILTLPHLDAFSPETLAVVESIKLRHPQPFIPAQFQLPSSDTGPGDRKENRRGRRVLAGEVAQLDAPVYAAQASAKKRHGMMSDTNSPSKRRKPLQTSIKSQAPTSTPTPVDEKYRVRWASNNLLSNRNNFPKLNITRLNHGAKVQFLTPNRFLEDDWCVDDYGVPQSITRPFPFIDMEATQQPTFAAKPAIIEPVQCIAGKNGTWPYLDLQFFEEKAINSNFTVRGWMPDIEWFHWADWAQSLEKRISANDIGRQYDAETAHDTFTNSLWDCLSVELAQTEQFVNTLPLAAGPHNIFINLSAGFENGTSSMALKWQSHENLTPQSIGKAMYDLRSLSSSDDSDSELDLDAFDPNHRKHLLGATDMNQSKIKRVSLITRPLTSIFRRETYALDEVRGMGAADSPLTSQEELLAAFIVVRVLLGGADKAIDWGILLHIFPNTRLASLRKFWAMACKEQRPHIKKFTRDVQERLIEAFESHELPMIDFEAPVHYDWRTLIKWATRISRQKNYQIPPTRELLSHRFSLINATSIEEDWGERFFHAQSSIFSRFEAVTSEPGALRVDGIFDQGNDASNVQSLGIARSWIKSLCCTSEAKYSVRKIKEKFLTLSGDGAERSSLLLKEAIVQLTIQRVICRSKKTPLGGRPYRLSEWYLSTLSRVAQRSKYQDAAAFKTQMDDKFRTGGVFEIPYTLNDGSMMALTNLNAAGKIKLVPLDIPNIPFGFEPGNYESRKYPKSYYHFRLQAKPTNLYQYNEDIAVLHAVAWEDLPSTTLKGEIPQWIDFFGKNDNRRWSDILGAFCFTYATKGPMAAKDVCNSLSPILDEFEAKLIVEWGIRTNVLEEVMDGSSVTVGEWWWLAVPWQYNRSRE